MLDLFSKYQTKVSAHDVGFRKALYGILPCDLSTATTELQKQYACDISQVKDAYDALYEEMQHHVNVIQNFSDKVNSRISSVEEITASITEGHDVLTEEELNIELAVMNAVLEDEQFTEEEIADASSEITSLQSALAFLPLKDEYELLQQPYEVQMVEVLDEDGNSVLDEDKKPVLEEIPTDVPTVAAIKLLANEDVITITEELRDYVLAL